jgi:glutathione synthase/RimK-type ligase-like ATP-grasp enzyme
MKTVLILTAANLRPGASDRRADADLFDRQVSILDAACRPNGVSLETCVWSDIVDTPPECAAALALAVWDYQDQPDSVLNLLQRFESAGIPVFNPLPLIRWNIRKTYLKELERAGVRTLPTIWVDAPTASDVHAAFESFGTGDVIVKRQIGGGARGQVRFRRADAPVEGSVLDRPGMIQPFMPSICEEGEYTFVFIEGAFSHAVCKKPVKGDYRIQTRFGGVASSHRPAAQDLDEARRVLAALPERPLYARVDMVRDEAGCLNLMELEVFEPFLFAHLGPNIGDMFAGALKDRLA